MFSTANWSKRPKPPMANESHVSKPSMPEMLLAIQQRSYSEMPAPNRVSQRQSCRPPILKRCHRYTPRDTIQVARTEVRIRDFGLLPEQQELQELLQGHPTPWLHSNQADTHCNFLIMFYSTWNATSYTKTCITSSFQWMKPVYLYTSTGGVLTAREGFIDIIDV